MKRKLKGAPSAPSAPNYYHHCHVNQPLPFFDSFCLGTGHASKKPQTLTPNTLFLTGIALRNSLRSILHHLPWGYDGLCLWLPLRVHPANSHCFLGRDQSGCDWSAFLGRCQWINYLVFFFLKKMRHQGVFQKKRIIYIYTQPYIFPVPLWCFEDFCWQHFPDTSTSNGTKICEISQLYMALLGSFMSPLKRCKEELYISWKTPGLNSAPGDRIMVDLLDLDDRKVTFRLCWMIFINYCRCFNVTSFIRIVLNGSVFNMISWQFFDISWISHPNMPSFCRHWVAPCVSSNEQNHRNYSMLEFMKVKLCWGANSL